MLFLARFLLRNLKGYLIFVVITLLVTVVQVLATLLIPNLGKFIFDKVGSTHADPSPPFINILNYFDPVKPGHLHSASSVIVFLMIMLIVTGVLIGIFTYIQLFLASYIAQNLTARLREKLFDQLQRLSLDWHGRQKKGDLVQRISGDIASIEKFVTDGLVDLLADVLTLGGVVVFLLLAQWQLTLVAIVLIPSLFIMIFLYTRSIKAAAKRASKATGEVAEVAAEDVGAITVLKAFSLEDREAIRFNRYVGKSRKAALQAGGLQAQFTPLVNILVAAGTAVIFGVGGFAVATGKFPIVNIEANPAVTAGTLFLFISYVGYLFQPMKDLSKLANVINSAFAGAERIQEVLDQTPEIVESRVPYNGPQRLKGDIVFDHVVFGYTPEHPILKGINLHIAAGKKVALVGLSGGGKTTLVKLIPRFYELQAGSGSVLIDGIDSRNIPLPVLRRNVSQVLQESVLFEGTILDNIKIGRPEATMEEIVSACKQAHIHETIVGLDDGYNTKVRERGKNFSGGQRQRLAIARAILCDSPILVLDEPTASLDVEAEVEVLRAIDTLVVGRTVLMISHRLTTLGNVDEIIVLKDGRIVEQGNYQELKRKDGVFAGLLKEQNRYNVDYVGGSMIVPRAELDRLVKGQRNPAVQGQKVPGRELASSNGQSNGMDGRRKARIAVEVDGKMIREFELDKPELRVGRMAANDICVPSERISRLHASISWVKDAWWIEDAQSLNGLTCKGEHIDRYRLTNGDRIYMAPKVVLTYREESAPVAVSSRPFRPESPAPRVPPSPMPLAATVLPLPQPLQVPQARIVIEVDGQVIVTRSLDKETLTVGRQPGNDVQIPSTLVSGQHGTLTRQDGKWLIIDGRSRNGLTYRGQRVERHILSQGDRVYLAPTVVLRFEQM